MKGDDIMTFFYRYKKKKQKLQAYCLKNKKEFPPPFLPDEPDTAKELRAVLSGKIHYSDNGSLYVFFNQLTLYPPQPCQSCEAFYNGQYRTVTVEELYEDTDWLRVNGQYLYPMMVWAIKKDTPVLVQIRPGERKPIKIYKNPPKSYMAYTICASK